MGPFVVEFYETRDGQRPAEDFLDELDIKMRSKLVMTLKVLQEQGNRLREPYSKHLDDGIFEIRGKVGTDISRVRMNRAVFLLLWGKDHSDERLYQKDPENTQE